jgi:hypothetical protein
MLSQMIEAEWREVPKEAGGTPCTNDKGRRNREMLIACYALCLWGLTVPVTPARGRRVGGVRQSSRLPEKIGFLFNGGYIGAGAWRTTRSGMARSALRRCIHATKMALRAGHVERPGQAQSSPDCSSTPFGGARCIVIRPGEGAASARSIGAGHSTDADAWETLRLLPKAGDLQISDGAAIFLNWLPQ